MKFGISLLAVISLLFATGCRTHVDGGYDYGHHGSVSVGVHGDAKTGAVLGALVVGGLIGAMIVESEQKKIQKAKAAALEEQKQAEQASQPAISQQQVSMQNLEQEIERAKQASNDRANLQQGYIGDSNPKEAALSNSDADANQEAIQALNSKPNVIHWYQVGKDNNCYLMSVDNGVTDIVEAVDSSNCK